MRDIKRFVMKTGEFVLFKDVTLPRLVSKLRASPTVMQQVHGEGEVQPEIPTENGVDPVLNETILNEDKADPLILLPAPTNPVLSSPEPTTMPSGAKADPFVLLPTAPALSIPESTTHHTEDKADPVMFLPPPVTKEADPIAVQADPKGDAVIVYLYLKRRRKRGRH